MSNIIAEQGPAHVPANLVKNVDLSGATTSGASPYEVLAGLHDGPRVFYNLTRAGGARGERGEGLWVLTRAEDIRAAPQNSEVFSSQASHSFAEMVGESWRLIPLDLDPPEHSKFRTILNGIFPPAKVAALEEGVRPRAVSLIQAFERASGCEFVEAFGRPFPVSIFMQLMGLPEEDTDRFNAWEYGLLHSPDITERLRSAKEIVGYLCQLIAKRKAEPANDLVTLCINAKVDDRPVTDDEIMGMCFLLFIAGLDTVAASLSLQFRHLALNPEHQAQLRADPSLIPSAVEELLRRYPIVNSTRIVRQDVDFAGVHMRAGERVLVSTVLANLDPDEFEAPLTVDLERSPNRHVSFLYGPHRCIGSHLARRELIIAIEEWTKRIPPFRIADGVEAPVKPGGLLGVHNLPLVWG